MFNTVRACRKPVDKNSYIRSSLRTCNVQHGEGVRGARVIFKTSRACNVRHFEGVRETRG
jgi:hypothetical protein